MTTELLKQARDALAKSEPTGIYKYSMTAAKRHENLIKEIDAALSKPSSEDAWLKQAKALLSKAMFASAARVDWVLAGDAVMEHLRSRPARKGFVSVPVEALEAQWDAAWLELQTRSDFKGIRAKLSAYEVRAIFTMLHKAMIEAAKGDGK